MDTQQEDTQESVAEVLFYFDYPAGSWDETVMDSVRDEYLNRASIVLSHLSGT